MQLVLASPAAVQPAGLAREERRGAQQQRAAAAPRRRAAALFVRASSLDSNSLLTSNSLTSNSSLLGPKAPGTGGSSLGSPLGTPSSSKPKITLDDVPLESGVSQILLLLPPLPMPHPSAATQP